MSILLHSQGRAFPNGNNWFFRCGTTPYCSSIQPFAAEAINYQSDRDGLPRGWIKRMKRTIRTLGWRFNADRMVMDYTLKTASPQ